MALVAHLRGDPRLLGGFADLAAFPHGANERLFAVYVLALRQRPEGDREVHVVGRADHDGVDVLVHLVEHHAVVAESRNVREGVVTVGGAAVVGVAKRDELRVGRTRDGVDRVAAPAAHSDHGHIELVVRA